MENKRAILAMLRKPRDPLWRFKFEEFKKLAIAAGYDIVGEIFQVKATSVSTTLFGRGKIEEIRKMADTLYAEVIIVYNVLKSIQKMNLELMTQRKVLDRYDLILEIFATNASDATSKLQIELAKIQKEMPYIRLVTSLNHQKDRPFIRAGGEYGWKPTVAELRRRMKKIREEIHRSKENKIRLILERKEKGFVIVCIVGYYNAGKTTLFNVLTGEEKPVSNKPFTTLSSKYSRLLGSDKILLVDTIGFVIDLDPRIIKSFEINIDDMRYADILLFVVDSSDPLGWLKIKVETAIKTLKETGALSARKPLIIAMNKIDLIHDKLEEESKKLAVEEVLSKNLSTDNYKIISISAKKSIGLNTLVKELVMAAIKANEN